jgi:hypothetical protein
MTFNEQLSFQRAQGSLQGSDLMKDGCAGREKGSVP